MAHHLESYPAAPLRKETALATGSKELSSELKERFPRKRGQLLPALHFLQQRFGYLPDWAIEEAGRHLRIPASEVYSAATSYTKLRVRKPGKHTLRVCTGLTCGMNGGGDLFEAAHAELESSPGEASFEKLVTLEETPCGVLCAMAPAIEWDGQWTGRTDPEAVRRLLREVRET